VSASSHRRPDAAADRSNETFNQIKAPKAGTVTAVLVQSGAPVEYGEALIVLE